MKPAEIRDLIARPWRHGDCVDLACVVCEGPLDLAGLELTCFELIPFSLLV